MKKKYLINIYFIILLSYNVSSQSIKENKDSVHYDYEKYKATFDAEMEKFKANSNFKEDTALTIEVTKNLANYFNQFNKPKFNSKDLHIISCGKSKNEILINFILQVGKKANEKIFGKLKNINNSNDTTESVSSIIRNFNIGKRLIFKDFRVHYVLNDKEKFEQTSNIYFINDFGFYLITAYNSLDSNENSIVKEDKYTIFEISNTDTSIIAKYENGKLSYLDKNDLFNQSFKRYFSNLGFDIEFYLDGGFGIFSISKRKIRTMQKLEDIEMPVTLPIINNQDELQNEFDEKCRAVLYEKINDKIKIDDFDLQKYKEEMNKEMEEYRKRKNEEKK